VSWITLAEVRLESGGVLRVQLTEPEAAHARGRVRLVFDREGVEFCYVTSAEMRRVLAIVEEHSVA
jgi:hypothetical protein